MPVFQGGQIANFLTEWEKLSSDPWLLGSVKGVQIAFHSVPCQVREPQPFKFSQAETDFVEIELVRMLEKGILETALPELGQVISNIFLRPKKDGSYRFILDLMWLNEHVEYEHFKMHSMNTALEMMRPSGWLGSIDLKDAYYSVPVVGPHRKFLRFRWDGRMYQFRVLPNGSACAPRFFTSGATPLGFITKRSNYFELVYRGNGSGR